MFEKSIIRSVTEVIGTLSILVTLVLVVIELRQANNLAEAEAVLSINQMIADKLNGNAQNEWWMRPLAERRGVDIVTFVAGFERYQWLNIYEAAWKSFDRGIINERQLKAYLQGACREIFQGEDADEFPWAGGLSWDEFKSDYNPGYIKTMELQCENGL